AWRTVLAHVLRGGGGRRGGGSHDGLHSKHSWRRASTAICTCGTCRHLDTRPPSPTRVRVPGGGDGAGRDAVEYSTESPEVLLGGDVVGHRRRGGGSAGIARGRCCGE